MLGNTAAIWRKCCIHPAIITRCMDGRLARTLRVKADSEISDICMSSNQRRQRFGASCGKSWNVARYPDDSHLVLLPLLYSSLCASLGCIAHKSLRALPASRCLVRFDIIRSFGWAPCNSVRFPVESQVTDSLRSWEGDRPPFRHRAICKFRFCRSGSTSGSRL
jgi:hypothetical protein